MCECTLVILVHAYRLQSGILAATPAAPQKRSFDLAFGKVRRCHSLLWEHLAAGFPLFRCLHLLVVLPLRSLRRRLTCQHARSAVPPEGGSGHVERLPATQAIQGQWCVWFVCSGARDEAAVGVVLKG